MGYAPAHKTACVQPEHEPCLVFYPFQQTLVSALQKKTTVYHKLWKEVTEINEQGMISLWSISPPFFNHLMAKMFPQVSNAINWIRSLWRQAGGVASAAPLLALWRFFFFLHFACDFLLPSGNQTNMLEAKTQADLRASQNQSLSGSPKKNPENRFLALGWHLLVKEPNNRVLSSGKFKWQI